MDSLQELMYRVFATHCHFLTKAQNFHWNVTGPDFLEYHELFGKIYEELEEHTDEFAEHIRAQGYVVPASFKEYMEMSMLKDPEEYKDQLEMVACLHRDTNTMLQALLKLYKQSETEGHPGFSSFLAERLSAHGKHGWQLYSSLI